MAQQRKGLGKGFESLIPTHVIDEDFDLTSDKTQVVEEIAVKDVEPNPHQPRREFNEQGLQALAGSIDRYGLMQPIVVTRAGAKKYQLIAGERRLRAFKQLGRKQIPAIIRTAEEQAQMELALIENLQREDLNILEVATALFKLSDQFSLSVVEVGKRVGRSGSSVTNIIRLLALPKFAKEALASNAITEGHARQLLALTGQEPKQRLLLDYIVKFNWNVRQAENFVRNFKNANDSAQESLRQVRATNDTTVKIAKKLNTKVYIKHMARTNQLIVEFKSDADLDKISKQIMS